MTAFAFQAEPKPLPRWMGPFSPSRGMRSGFRFHQGRLGTWVSDEHVARFWSLVDGSGARGIATLVRGEWGGGRVLMLPNGFVVKPLQADEEVGVRVLIGRFRGQIKLESPGQPPFDLSNPGLKPGDRWCGPSTTGLECTIRPDGSLRCTWYHPTEWGRDEVTEPLRGPDPRLAAGFRAARPGSDVGRVRVTAHGHVITNRKERGGAWAAMYVGYAEPSSWTGWDRWIERKQA